MPRRTLKDVEIIHHVLAFFVNNARPCDEPPVPGLNNQMSKTDSRERRVNTTTKMLRLNEVPIIEEVEEEYMEPSPVMTGTVVLKASAIKSIKNKEIKKTPAKIRW